ncbi:MORC family CW-type zinc finger protein 3-like isoform X1 [Babylonia areolata]|uniref:MORC family CW-type zinc finger protein 3-like isoform X1 n=1 Tax=Babylonia areolata TaxID=304850 RepID=UPI003FD44380
MATLTRGIPLSKISPKFLHSNATSHTGPFSAIAELIDNAYDPDVSANELHIGKCVIHGKPCLVFQDDGSGMDYESLLKMLSFGYCDKTAFESNPNHLPIGHYGNGFKSGSMRLGKDALVFTVCKKSASVGFLSQNYLETIGADCVFVPMIEYRLPHLERIKSQESRNNLEAIMSHSPFHSEQDLKAELQTLRNGRTGTGTKIAVYNLRRHKDGKMELDFESDSSDIRNPEAHEVDLTSVYHRTTQVESSEHMRSLRVYCSILFLRPRMKIYIQGVKVKTQLISKSLSNTETDVYKPTWLTKPLRITFGFSTQEPVKEDYGVMFYHRNRLIKAYEKLGCQKQPNDLGIGVVGVVQVDFLKPIHNKQDFEKDEKYNAIMSSISVKLNDYWNEKKNGSATCRQPEATPGQLPDWLWVQCERCLKWRRLPDTVRSNPLPDQWLCYMNPDPTHNRCDILEEPEDEDEAVQRPSYAKTFKRKLEEKKRKKQADIAAKEAELKAREEKLLEAQRQQEMNENDTHLAQVSSSEQNSHDIARLQRALLEARKREENHKRLIVKIQNQKKQVEDQHNSLIEAARNLRSVQTSATELLEVASALTDDSPVSSTSLGQKRWCSSEGGVSRKVMNITTDQGDTVTIERADSEDEGAEEETLDRCSSPDTAKPLSAPSSATAAPKPSTSTPTTTHPRRRRPRARTSSSAKVNVIDLTMEEEEPNTTTAATTTTEAPDVKPDVNQLHRRLETERQQASNTTTTNNSGVKGGKGAGGGGAGSRQVSGEREVKQEEEVGQQLSQLQQKHRLLARRFRNLQRNVHKLLSFIVPDVDLGTEEDIEHIVTEMIRVNCSQSQAS